MNNTTRRLLAAMIDFYIICFLASAFVCIITLGKMTTTPFTVAAYLVVYALLLLFKDIACKNASVGKRILKMQVVKTDNTRFTFLDAVRRTIPALFLLPVEIVLIICGSKRLGDVWTKTDVVMKQL